ncbi:cyclic nucleotide-binding domain-containing protein [Azoarcus indigens]|uniref:CRP-like cAMP-binding protein n=1 Tax=Azoarcus indigens TaxID=29545 RepID=A0A4V3BLV2_9RHOO|nr:Crp/Fnr family transcriptional regulator [Azoarcus indigens]NMG66591.1 cyclic nucleotide-binding domain-containing protein [Azoarcus indigens]TDN48102.1 CRP-like cAMP-binding protein [Azoarcus indigens]
MAGELPTASPALIAQLRQVPLFSELADEDIARIARQSRERALARGEVLFQRGDTPRGFFCVLRGQVKLAFSSAQGNEKVVEVIGAGQSFGEAVMFMERPYPVFAEALVDSTLLAIGHDAILGQLDEDPRFARKLLAGLSIRLHSLVRDVETYTLRSSTQRVIGYLLQQTPEDVDSGECRIGLPTSKQVIASRLNLTPETLSRIFHDLADSGLITVAGRHITLHDLRRLRAHEG